MVDILEKNFKEISKKNSVSEKNCQNQIPRTNTKNTMERKDKTRKGLTGITSASTSASAAAMVDEQINI